MAGTYQVGGCGDAEGTGRLQPPRGLESRIERHEGRVLRGGVVEAWPPLPVRRHDVRLRGGDRYLLGLPLTGLQAQREPGGQLPPPLLRLLQRLPPLQQLFLRPGEYKLCFVFVLYSAIRLKFFLYFLYFYYIIFNILYIFFIFYNIILLLPA